MAKKARRRSHRTVAPQAQPQPTITGLLTERMGPWAALAVKVTAIGTALGMCLLLWRWADGPTLVTSRALDEVIGSVRTDVTGKIGEARTALLSHSDKNTKEVQTEVSKVQDDVKGIARKQDAIRVQGLELQQRVLFQQKTQTQSSLNSVEAQLKEKPKDPVFLLGRKAELEGVLQYIDRESASVQEALRKARQGD
jgi:hypothetical protein